MLLQKVRVHNYRSIVDSGEVSLEPGVTVLIGKNEQGKTNFLRALESLIAQQGYEQSDLPRHLAPTLERRAEAEIPIVSAWFILGEADRTALQRVVPNAQVGEVVRISRYYDGHCEYALVSSNGTESELNFESVDTSEIEQTISTTATGLVGSLQEHLARVPDFAAGFEQAQQHLDAFAHSEFDDSEVTKSLFTTLTAGLNALPGQDKAIQDCVASGLADLSGQVDQLSQMLQDDAEELFWENIPEFVFHSATLDRIPDEVNVKHFASDPDGTAKGMANLCRAAGLSVQKLLSLSKSTDVAQRETFEDHYRAAISGGVNEYWTQEVYNVHFRIDANTLSISISDGTYAQRVKPSERSDGFQWYLSFFAVLKTEAKPTVAVVLLLDNPGLELHNDGQRDIKRYLEEKVPQRTQVVYVTHSPAMVDPFYLEQIRIVERAGADGGTTISDAWRSLVRATDLLEPIRTAIGSSLVATLFANHRSVLVEGVADKLILEGALDVACDAEGVVVNGSIAETGPLLPSFYMRAGLPFVVLLDADTGGRRLKDKLLSAEIAEDRIVELSACIERTGDDFELEDVLSTSFYHKAVRDAYPSIDIEQPKNVGSKRTKGYCDRFATKGIEFSKRRVAEKVKKLLSSGKADKETKANLRKVTDKLIATLNPPAK